MSRRRVRAPFKPDLALTDFLSVRARARVPRTGSPRCDSSGCSLSMRSKHSLFRAFSTLYFHLALSRLSRDPRSRTDTKGYERQLLYWEEQLTKCEGAFIDGEKPGTRDFMLFGVLQCHASIEVPPVAVLQTSEALPMLRGWIVAMQNRYPEYQHLYSGTYFEPARSKPEEASLVEQVAFWVGSVIVLLAFPLTVPLALHYQKKVRREKLL